MKIFILIAVSISLASCTSLKHPDHREPAQVSSAKECISEVIRSSCVPQDLSQLGNIRKCASLTQSSSGHKTYIVSTHTPRSRAVYVEVGPLGDFSQHKTERGSSDIVCAKRGFELKLSTEEILNIEDVVSLGDLFIMLTSMTTMDGRVKSRLLVMEKLDNIRELDIRSIGGIQPPLVRMAAATDTLIIEDGRGSMATLDRATLLQSATKKVKTKILGTAFPFSSNENN